MPVPDLPPFPRDSGPRAARKLGAERARYRAAIQRIENEIILAEDAFTEALAIADARQTTRERVQNLASRSRRQQRGQ